MVGVDSRSLGQLREGNGGNKLVFSVYLAWELSVQSTMKSAQVS